MKLSFIIPVYNGSASILKCLTSTIPYLNMECEAVVIDDGSTDDSASIVADLASKQVGIRLIKQENRGQSAARNEAIRQATGDYIWCLDSDDWLSSEGMKEIIDTIEKKKYDVIVIGRMEEYQNYSKKTPNIGLQEYANGMEYFDEAALTGIYRTQPWNMIVRRDIIIGNNVTFPEGRTFEDIYWGIDIFIHSKAVITLSVHPYHYQLANENSLTKQVHMRDLDIIWIINNCAHLLDEKGYSVKSNSPSFLSLIYWFVSSAIMKKYIPLYKKNKGAKEIVDATLSDPLFKRSIRYAATHYIGIQKSALALLMLISKRGYCCLLNFVLRHAR